VVLQGGIGDHFRQNTISKRRRTQAKFHSHGNLKLLKLNKWQLLENI
jgi:hypothetical protein